MLVIIIIMQEDTILGTDNMAGSKTDLVPAFMEFGPAIEGAAIFKAFNMVSGPGDSRHHDSYYYY